MSFTQYKLILVGDGECGKTSYIHRLYERELSRYNPTIGVEVHPYTFNNEGVIFNIWDTAGQEKFGGLRDGYYIQGACCMVFCSLDKLSSLQNASDWIRGVQRVCENIPFVLVLNKRGMSDENLRVWRQLKRVYPQMKSYKFDVKNASLDKIKQPLLDLIVDLRAND